MNITGLENIIADAANDKGYAFSVATPSRENFEASSYTDKKVLWYDIQQDGNFFLGEDGLQMEARLKLHFLDDHWWDAEDESANLRKNAILAEAFEVVAAVNARLTSVNAELVEAPSWEVLYAQFDQNKIDVSVIMRVRSNRVKYC